MNDILLTETERRELVHKTVNLSLMGASEAICRAQVRKVAEWLLKNNNATEANLPDPAIDGEGVNRGWSGYRIFEGELLVREDLVVALKAAGGEGAMTAQEEGK